MLTTGVGDYTVLPATHTQTTPVFTPQPQSITALWLVLTASTRGGMARLSSPGYLVIDAHGGTATSLIETDVTKPNHRPNSNSSCTLY